MKDLIVKHKTFGEGKVCAVEGNRVSVSFADAEKIFSAEHFFDFFTTDPETAQSLRRNGKENGKESGKKKRRKGRRRGFLRRRRVARW